MFIAAARRALTIPGAYLSGQEKRISRYHERIDDYIEGKI